MKRKDIARGGVYSLVSYRDSRQGWPVMILSQDSYQLHHRTHVLDFAGNDRLVQGSPGSRKSAVGLLSVRLMFDMHSGQGDDGDQPPMDVLTFRAKVEQVRKLVSVPSAIKAIQARVTEGFTETAHLHTQVKDADGNVLGHYELLTSLQMVVGPYIELTLAERRAEAQRNAWASELEQERVAAVARHNAIAGRLGNLGVMIARAADYEHPSMVKLTFEQAERLLSLAESADLANKQAGIGT